MFTSTMYESTISGATPFVPNRLQQSKKIQFPFSNTFHSGTIVVDNLPYFFVSAYNALLFIFVFMKMEIETNTFAVHT